MGDGPRHLRVDRMEDVMLGTKRTLSFWRAKKRLVVQERALAPNRDGSANEPALAPPALAAA